MNPKQADTTLRSLISPVQLSTSDQVAGTIFYKQLFTYGQWLNPMWWWDDEPFMELTADLAQELVNNFNNNVLGSPVPVPLNHTDDVTANTGTVIKLEVGTDGLYGYLDIKRPQTVDDINNGLIYDVSIGWDSNYISQKDGLSKGAVLCHVALVNTPYINNMTGFTETELAKRNAEYAKPLTVSGKASVIMMSKAKVEELKSMTFAKVKNDKDYEIEVKYDDADGKEVVATVKPGEEVEVPKEAKEAVETQISDSTAPEADPTGEDDNLTDEERQAKAKKEADEKAAKEGADTREGGEGDTPVAGSEDAVPAPNGGTSADAELAKSRARIAELEADKQYSGLLSSGHIAPAQENLFKAFAKIATGEMKLSTDIKGKDGKVLFAKDKSVSVVTMLSAILEAGPKFKVGEKGADGEGEDGEVELTKEQEDKITHMGFNVETFKKQLAKGTIKLTDIEE